MDGIHQKERESMTAHPNRSKKTLSPARSPTKEQISAVRAKANLTQPAAAALVYKTLSAWKKYEMGIRNMPADTWELFNIKLKDLSMPEAPAK